VGPRRSLYYRTACAQIDSSGRVHPKAGRQSPPILSMHTGTGCCERDRSGRRCAEPGL